MEESDPIPLSALQYWAHYPPRCGLIHLEQVFEDSNDCRVGSGGESVRGERVDAEMSATVCPLPTK